MNPFEHAPVSPIGDTGPSHEGDRCARLSTTAAGASRTARRPPSGSRQAGRDPFRFSRTLVFLVLVAAACTPAPGEGGGARSEAAAGPAADAAPQDTASAALADTLMRRIEDAYDFTQPDVVERMSSLYPDTGRVISASGGYVTTTVDSLRQGLADFWANVGVNMSDPRWEWGDVHVDRLATDAAVLTASWSIPHVAPTGRPHTIRGAWTAVFRRIDGEWLIVQEHLSVPAETP